MVTLVGERKRKQIRDEILDATLVSYRVHDRIKYNHLSTQPDSFEPPLQALRRFDDNLQELATLCAPRGGVHVFRTEALWTKKHKVKRLLRDNQRLRPLLEVASKK
jgi:hypothetical protein